VRTWIIGGLVKEGRRNRGFSSKWMEGSKRIERLLECLSLWKECGLDGLNRVKGDRLLSPVES
jgi:hypothetical protein